MINQDLKRYFIKTFLPLYLLGGFSTHSLAVDPPSYYFGIQLFAPSFHLSKDTIHFGEEYSYKLDSAGKVVLMPGVKAFFDYQDHQANLVDFWRFAASYYKDCMNQDSFVIHAGPRWTYTLNDNWDFILGLGPAFWARKSWTEFSQYYDDGFMKQGDKILSGYQYLIVPGGDLEFQYRINESLFFNWTIIPAIPYVLFQSFGLRWY